MFKDSAVNVTVQGQKHLNAVISSREYLEEYVGEKVTNWVGEVTKLAEFALSQPQACYAAYTFGMIHHWTLPDDSLVKPLQQTVRSERAKVRQDRATHIREERQLHRKSSEHLTLLQKKVFSLADSTSPL